MRYYNKLELYLEFPFTVRMGPWAERRRMEAGIAVRYYKELRVYVLIP